MRKVSVGVCLGMVGALALISCRETAPQPDPTPTPAPTATASATASPSGARSVVEETDDFLFEYSYPAEAGNVPELASLLDRRLTSVRAELVRDSAAARQEARDSGFPFNAYSTGVAWAVVADTPRFLSLSATITSYSGGAHGNMGFDALVWDKEAGRALDPGQLFTSAAALEEVLGAGLCDQLQRERTARRGQVPTGEGTFEDCVPLADTTLLLGSSNGRVFNRIGVMIGPYVAGPYAEGSYEFTLPVDAAVLAAVREEYRPAFAARN
jgi:hypothetical protein